MSARSECICISTGRLKEDFKNSSFLLNDIMNYSSKKIMYYINATNQVDLMYALQMKGR
jgi:hypothetical protein